MNYKTKKTLSHIAIHLLLIFGIIFIVLPLYITVVTAFKTPEESAKSFFSLPSSFYIDNFKQILSRPNYFVALKNTLYITVFALLGEVIIMPMMSYAVVKSMDTSRFYKGVYILLIVGIFIPFQVKMMPLAKIMSSLKLMSTTGLIILTVATATCSTVFLLTGFMKNIPKEMEEAAEIDGASTFQTYTQIIFPLLKPVLATVMITDGLWIWNDFQMPLIVLNRSWENWTLTLLQHNFQSEYSIDYTLVFTTMVLSILPIMIFYLIMQKHIIGGLTTGAVKG